LIGSGAGFLLAQLGSRLIMGAQAVCDEV